MNHKNNVELEGIVQIVRPEVKEGKESVSIFLKSTNQVTFKGKSFDENFSIWLKVFGKLAQEAKTLKKDDLIKITGAFKTQAKEVETKAGMIKVYSVQINVKTIEKLIVNEGLIENFDDTIPF